MRRPTFFGIFCLAFIACDGQLSSTRQSVTPPDADPGAEDAGRGVDRLSDAGLALPDVGEVEPFEPGELEPPDVASPSGLSAVWANDGGDKVTRGELRATADPGAVLNHVWDGERVRLMAARNETVAFALVLESAGAPTADVSVSMLGLVGPGGARLVSRQVGPDAVFDWTARPIELFYVRYLQIRGISRAGFGGYDERHLPRRIRRPHDDRGTARGQWTDRPDHDAFYPDIAVPMERVPRFEVPADASQIVWVDVYVPKGTTPGDWLGHVVVREAGEVTRSVPVRLTVRDFTLPDAPASKTMVVLGYGDLNERYVDERFPSGGENAEVVRRVRDRHYRLARRHRVSLIDDGDAPEGPGLGAPNASWQRRLDGSIYTAEQGYAGPGEGQPHDVFAIGLYGSWPWKGEGEEGMHRNSDLWASWFAENAPEVEHFLYLADESDEYAQLETWARWIEDNPGPGSALPSMATLDAPAAVARVPTLDVVASTLIVADPAVWGPAVAGLVEDPEKRFYAYNGARPASGTFYTDDDGVSPRQVPWGQYKLGIERWFVWESTYYVDRQGGEGPTDLFAEARTFGIDDGFDPVFGHTGWRYTNGDGVLFYPGTDRMFPSSSHGLEGPIASLRLKHWRRGIQDVDYLALAAEIDPDAVGMIVQEMVPKAMWENGVDDPNDPTYVHTDISWSTDPDDWHAARVMLAEIIEAR